MSESRDPQALARQMQGDQRRRTRGVHRDRRAAQIQEIRQPVGDDAQRTTGVAPRVDAGQVGGGQVSVLADAGPDEDPGLRAAQRARRECPRAPTPPRPLPAADAAGGPSWRLRGARCRRIPRRRRRCRPRTSPNGWCGRESPRPRGEPSSNGAHRSGGTSPTADRPSDRNCQNASGPTIPPGNRHPRPMTAIGSSMWPRPGSTTGSASRFGPAEKPCQVANRRVLPEFHR